MNYRLGIYEKAMPDTLSIKEKLMMVKKLGFDYMEISVDVTDEKLKRLDYSFEEIVEIRRAIENSGVMISTMALSGLRRYPLGSPTLSDKGVEVTIKAIDFCEKVGIRVIQLAGYDTVDEESNEKTRKCFIDNMKVLASHAALKGVILAFENMNTSFTNSVKKCMELIEEINSPYVKLYPDYANLINFGDYEYDGENVIADLKLAKGNIVAAHIKETNANKERRIPYGSGNDHSRHIEHLTCLKELGCRMFLAEFWYKDSDYETVCIKASTFLRSKLDIVFKE